MIDFANQKSKLDSMREDEQILDKMFDRTTYGKMIEAVGTSLAEALIDDINRGGDRCRCQESDRPDKRG